MGDFHVAQGGRFQSIGNPEFITVAHNAAANTKGSYVTLIASTDFAWKAFALFVQSDVSGAGPTSSLTDIAVGAAASEVVILPDFHSASVVSTITIFTPQIAGYIPIAIPAGTRISARGQNEAGGTKNSYITIIGIGHGFTGISLLGRATSLGSSTATSRGVTVTSGTPGVKGNYAQITASAPHDIRYLLMMSGRQSANHAVDIAVGAAASEVIVVADQHVNTWCPLNILLPVAIPAGTRIAVRSAAAGVTNGQFDMALLAIG